MHTIFKNKELQEKYDRDGFVLLPWLSKDEVAQLRTTYSNLQLNDTKHFHSTSFLSDISIKQNINQAVEAVFNEKVSALFSEIKKLGSSFLTKHTGETGIMPVHQDWTIVDETKYSSTTIWVALEDIDENNGAMQVLPGSHRFSDTVRSPNIETDYKHLHDYLSSKMTTLPMKAGDALIFNHALFHASHPNNSSEKRLAVTYGLIPAEADLSLHIQEVEGKLSQYEMPDDMFLNYHEIGTVPSFGKKIKEIAFKLSPKSELYFEQKINQYTASIKCERIFKDLAIQASFDKNGYVVLPALNQTEVADLLAYYQSLQLKDDKGFGFHISMDQTDKSLVGKILDKLFEVALPKMSVHFENNKAFVGSFVIKEPNPTSIVPVHQDWSFVEDEERHTSMTCWVPLVDTTLENGAMALIKGSHRFFKNFRPSPSPQVPSPLSAEMFSIFPYLHLVEMKAGEMLVFDNRTFHGSPPNTTSEPRIAFGIGMTQKDAKLVHYYLNPNGPEKNEVYKYAIDEKFFRKYENSSLSAMYDNKEMIEGYPLEARLSFDLPSFTSEELIDLIKLNGNEFNVPMCEKLAKLFNYGMDGKKNEDVVEETVSEPIEQSQAIEEPAPWVWVDERPFLEKYSPKNILIEIKKKLGATAN